MINSRNALAAILISISAATTMAQSAADPAAFPAAPVLYADEPFDGCEGISFNGEGRLFVTCNRAFWEIESDGSVRQLTELFSNLGTAAYGDRDILVADFGPPNAFRDGRNTDGIIWRITPEGD